MLFLVGHLLEVIGVSTRQRFNLKWLSVKAKATGTFLDQRGDAWTTAASEQQAKRFIIARLKQKYKQAVFVDWEPKKAPQPRVGL